MDDIIKQDVLDCDSTLSTVNDKVWARVLPFVNQINLTSDDTDVDRTLARIYLAAHMGTILTPGASKSTAAGPVTSESVGGIRRSYANLAVAMTGNMLSTTKYGRAYLELLAMTFCNGPQLAG